MNNKILLTGLVLVSIASTTMAANTNQVLGNLNKTQFLNNSNVIGNSNEVSGKDNVVIGNSNKVAGYSAIAIGNNIHSEAQGYNSGSTSLWSEGRGSITIGDHTQTTLDGSTVIGHLAQSYGKASVAIGAYSIAYDDVHKVDSKYAGVKTNQGVFSIGNSYPSIFDKGTTPPNEFKVFTRQLQNVGAGAISATSTDAVNGSQLYDVMMEAKNHTIVQAGDNITVTEDSGTYTVSTAKDLTDMNSVNLNDGNSESHYTVKGIDMTYRGDFEYHTQYNYDGMHIKINDGDTQTVKDEVSLTSNGLDNGNNRIVNVSRGEKDTDAVNVSQLKEVDNKVNSNSNRINDLDNKINDVGRNALERANHYTDLQVNKGVAKASALAGLKYLDYNPKDKWSFAASVGHYRNANAVAVGAAYQPNENTMIHGGVTVDGKVVYNLGVSVKVGGQKYVNKYELAEQVRQLQSDNAELRQELNELRSLIGK